MSASVQLENLIAYSDHERAKWKIWLTFDPSRLTIPFQTGARFPTVGGLLMHIFWVEERHLARLEGKPVPDTTGIPHDDLNALFEFGDRVRANLVRFVRTADEKRIGETITFALGTGQQFTVIRRKLTAHILLHEIRHFAQIAYAARVAGHEPPGEHDYFFAPVDLPDMPTGV
jgi:uncharacterized damage-inducible protein DinB